MFGKVSEVCEMYKPSPSTLPTINKIGAFDLQHDMNIEESKHTVQVNYKLQNLPYISSELFRRGVIKKWTFYGAAASRKNGGFLVGKKRFFSYVKSVSEPI